MRQRNPGWHFGELHAAAAAISYSAEDKLMPLWLFLSSQFGLVWRVTPPLEAAGVLVLKWAFGASLIDWQSFLPVD